MNKKLLFVGVVMFCFIAFWSCKTDFSVNGDYKITPIVYGLLDQNESYHYIRINKTFLGDGSALDFAKVPDSSYFSSVNAKISEVINGSVTRTWTLRDTIVHNKSTNGVFYAPDQKLFYFVTPPDAADYPTTPNPGRLKENATYKLEAILDNGAYKVTASTELVQDVNFTAPSNFSFYNESSSTPYKNPSIPWDLGNAQIYQMEINFYFNQFIGADSSLQYVNWVIKNASRDDLSGSTAAASAPGKDFYTIVANSLSGKSADKRVPHHFEIVLTAALRDVQTYMLANAPSSSIAQNKSIFTNIDGGMGLFSARTTIKKSMLCIDPIMPCNRRALDQKSTRFLCLSSVTGGLNFCSNNPQDGGTGCSVGTTQQTFYCN